MTPRRTKAMGFRGSNRGQLSESNRMSRGLTKVIIFVEVICAETAHPALNFPSGAILMIDPRQDRRRHLRREGVIHLRADTERAAAAAVVVTVTV